MSYQLKIDISSYWHPGTGKGQGSHLDTVTHRNSYGLPVLPGRTVKGIVRDAVTRWENYKDNTTDTKELLVSQLFGSGADGEETSPGILRFSDAGLASSEADYLITQPELIRGLYRTHFSTAIELKTGTAEQQSLRGIEMVVPLVLYATVDIIPNLHQKEAPKDWDQIIKPALFLIHSIGAHRTRGFGRAKVTLEGGNNERF